MREFIFNASKTSYANMYAILWPLRHKNCIFCDPWQKLKATRESRNWSEQKQKEVRDSLCQPTQMVNIFCLSIRRTNNSNKENILSTFSPQSMGWVILLRKKKYSDTGDIFSLNSSRFTNNKIKNMPNSCRVISTLIFFVSL